jgi:hypothetical protein
MILFAVTQWYNSIPRVIFTVEWHLLLVPLYFE